MSSSKVKSYTRRYTFIIFMVIVLLGFSPLLIIPFFVFTIILTSNKASVGKQIAHLSLAFIMAMIPILYMGKLEKDRQADEFAEAFCAVLGKKPPCGIEK